MPEDTRDNRNDKVEKRSGRRGREHSSAFFLVLGLSLLFLGAGAGAAGSLLWARRYDSVFFPRTTVNGVDVSGETAKGAWEKLSDAAKGYRLMILERNGGRELINGQEIRLVPEYSREIETLLKEQQGKAWWNSLKQGTDYEIAVSAHWDEELLAKKVAGLSCMDESAMKEPQAPHLSEYNSEKKGYEVLEGDPGTKLSYDAVLLAVQTAIAGMEETVDLDEAGCYETAGEGEEWEALERQAKSLNFYTQASVTYSFGEETEVIDGDQIHDWLSLDGEQAVIDEAQAAAFVKELADQRDTAGKEKTLQTSYGPVVTIKEGTYGWKIDQEKETKALLANVRAGENVTREPEYAQTAASHGTADYGDTYVEINLTAQHLYYYKKGLLVTESDFVSGNAARGWSTPAGAYPLRYKQRNAVLVGKTYRTPVSYWMPFNRGIGLHDATWRGSFGGGIYKNNGSHGCINLPPPVAKAIYQEIEAGTPVLCYHLEGTERSRTTAVRENGAGASSWIGKSVLEVAAGNGPGTETVRQAENTAGALKESESAVSRKKAATVKPSAAEKPKATAPAPSESAAPTQAETTARETENAAETSGTETGTAAFGPTAPVQTAGEPYPAGSSGNADGPGAESQAETAPSELPVQTAAAPYPVETEPLSGNDENQVGPGFGTPQTEVPIGPGY